MDPRTGGVAQAVRTLVPALQQAGASSQVLCLDAPSNQTAPIPIESIGLGIGPWCYNSDLTRWLNKTLSDFDAVIMHGMWQYTGYAVAKSIRKHRRLHPQCPRHYVMPHGMLDPWFQREKSRRFKAWRNWLYWKVIEGGTTNGCDGLLYTCERERELARVPFRPFHPRAEYVVGLGVDEPPPFRPQMQEALRALSPAIGQRPYLLFLGRIHPKKGVQHLIEQYAEIAASSIDKDALPMLVIAGPLESSYTGEMIRLARQRQLYVEPGQPHCGPGILFTGMLQGDAKWGALYGCEAFVLPSHQENFGIAVVESLACGKPVLISDQINIYAEIERAGAAIVRSDTATGVREMLTSWLGQSANQREKMGAGALECYRQCFRPEATAHKLIAAIGR